MASRRAVASSSLALGVKGKIGLVVISGGYDPVQALFCIGNMYVCMGEVCLCQCFWCKDCREQMKHCHCHGSGHWLASSVT